LCHLAGQVYEASNDGEWHKGIPAKRFGHLVTLEKDVSGYLFSAEHLQADIAKGSLSDKTKVNPASR
jgi:hypothetical protein